MDQLSLLDYELTEFERQEPETPAEPPKPARKFKAGDRVVCDRWPNRVGKVIGYRVAGMFDCDFGWPVLNTIHEKRLSLAPVANPSVFSEWRWWPNKQMWTYCGHMSLDERPIYPGGMMFPVGIDPNSSRE